MLATDGHAFEVASSNRWSYHSHVGVLTMILALTTRVQGEVTGLEPDALRA